MSEASPLPSAGLPEHHGQPSRPTAGPGPRARSLLSHFTDEEDEAQRTSCPDIPALQASCRCSDLGWQRRLESPVTPLAGLEPPQGTLSKGTDLHGETTTSRAGTWAGPPTASQALPSETAEA